MNLRAILAPTATAALLTGVVGTGLALAAAPAAEAHDQALAVSCTSIGLTLTNYPQGSTVSGTVDGVDLGSSTFGPSFSQSAALDPAVPHTWSIVVVSGDGDHRFDRTFVGQSDPACIPVVTPPVTTPPVVVPPTEEPTPPVTTPPTTIPPVDEPTTPPVVTPPVDVIAPLVQDYVSCTGGAFVLDNTGSTVPVVYTINGIDFTVPAGAAVHTDADGTLISPVDGSIIRDLPGRFYVTAADRSWTFTAPKASECGTVPPTEVPTDEPTTPETTAPVTPTTPEVAPTVAPTVAPVTLTTTPAPVAATVTPAPVAADTTTAPDGLAYTGTPLAVWIAAAFALALLALGIVLAARRRQVAAEAAE